MQESEKYASVGHSRMLKAGIYSFQQGFPIGTFGNDTYVPLDKGDALCQIIPAAVQLNRDVLFFEVSAVSTCGFLIYTRKRNGSAFFYHQVFLQYRFF